MSGWTPTLDHPELRLGKQAQTNWLTFKQQFEDYELIMDLKKKSASYQAAVLRSCFGKEGMDIYRGLDFATDADKNKKETIMEPR